jgi:hypothetical protein
MVDVAMRFTAPDTNILVARASDWNEIRQSSCSEGAMNLVAGRRRCNREWQLLVQSPMHKVENPGQWLYAGRMEQSQILLGARLQQLVDAGGQLKHGLQVFPKGDFGGTDVRFEGLFAERLAVTRQDLHRAVVVQTLGVDQSSIEIEQNASQRARQGAWRGRWHSFGQWWVASCAALIVLALSACSNPAAQKANRGGETTGGGGVVVIEADRAAVQVHLPDRYAHWQEQLQAELIRMEQDYQNHAVRWQREEQVFSEPRRIAVPADSDAANVFYLSAGLAGDPSTPRTFPQHALAVVPLPRNDSLIAALESPPRTWLHSFRHEAAHLFSLDYPQLRAAPQWFQEGYAELWCEGPPPPTLNGLEAWPFWRTLALRYGPGAQLPEAPGEIRYSAFAMRTAEALQYDSSATPWASKIAQSWSLPADVVFYTPYLGLRGRDADWDTAQRRFLLASRPGQQVELDLVWPWDGEQPLVLEMQHGRAPSEPEAGLILSSKDTEPATSPRVRIRLGQNGGWAAYPESGTNTRFEALSRAPQPATAGLPHKLILRRQGSALILEGGDFRRRFELKDLQLQFPLQLRMYVRDGALALRYR